MHKPAVLAGLVVSYGRYFRISRVFEVERGRRCLQSERLLCWLHESYLGLRLDGGFVYLERAREREGER